MRCNCDIKQLRARRTHAHRFPLHTVRLGDSRALRATGLLAVIVTALLLEPTVNPTCVLAVTASWSVRVYVAARERPGCVLFITCLLFSPNLFASYIQQNPVSPMGHTYAQRYRARRTIRIRRTV